MRGQQMTKLLLFVTTLCFGIIYFYKYKMLVDKYNYDIVELESEADIFRKNR
ncbi:hypothetical protein [Staphylococcus lugdunensis]|uniref:Uncharacterized protein n=1 Tax=Staphylococcus lugdunensis TaxID=28035 RepID=A0ABD4ECT5_STALU|nr:hypothetical protein [Staphylococcus lugdunensis]ADC88309.1 hypothetical protein SLGD_02222 [Staphylococcus lugdunensis HKU09-01]EFU84497.1 hypothetical protein HMPREF0790_1124 [Staphylococcus lugdunensis M23590]EHS03017.1 hypothetical protein SEVCU139_1209 [Staphylococcus lugdunensis VCU139]KAK56831.1 hypothetical protein SLVCU150_1827 [Staphylococcus lugdunensis VCU150]KAK58715.1 hypothetical protein SLVCU148_1217 [Staphylococcus lugdunensis VCU148]